MYLRFISQAYLYLFCGLVRKNNSRTSFFFFRVVGKRASQVPEEEKECKLNSNECRPLCSIPHWLAPFCSLIWVMVIRVRVLCQSQAEHDSSKEQKDRSASKFKFQNLTIAPFFVSPPLFPMIFKCVAWNSSQNKTHHITIRQMVGTWEHSSLWKVKSFFSVDYLT